MVSGVSQAHTAMNKRWDRPPQRQAVGSLALRGRSNDLTIEAEGTPECEVDRVELLGPLKPGESLRVDPQWSVLPAATPLLWDQVSFQF